MATDTITLGVQSGSTEASDATRPFFMPLRKLLAKHCVGPYSKDIVEFAPILRIDGDVWAWHFEGCEALKLNRRERYVTIDIGVPEERWRANGLALATYLVTTVEEALRQMIDRVKQKGLDLNDAALLADFEQVRTEYMTAMAANHKTS